MDHRFEKVLSRYRSRLAQEDDLMVRDPVSFVARRNEYLLAVGEDAGWLLHTLAVGRKAQRILEIGTSYGYSTLFLANAARQNGGRVHSIELVAEKQQYARAQLEEAGLQSYVDWQLGDATRLIGRLDGFFDFVFVDLWKDLYVPCLELFYPKLAENALIAADNMLSPKDARPHAERYRAAVRAKPALHTVLLPIGNGIELSCLWNRDPA